MSAQLISLSVFLVALALIISEKFDKTVVALTGALILLLLGYTDFPAALRSVDFGTICLLLGMMIVVECLREIKAFDLVSLKLGLLTRGDPLKIFFLFSITTALLSAFLDNVTTVLVMVPLIIFLTRSVGVAPRPFLLALIFMSNIGGTWTMIGDPPNILIGSQVPELTFLSFMVYLGTPVFVSVGLVLWFLRRRYRDAVQSSNSSVDRKFVSSLLSQSFSIQALDLNVSYPALVSGVSVLALIFLGFLTHSLTHLEPAVVALAGAAMLMVVLRNHLEVHVILSKVEWATLLFFAGLFIMVGVLQATGVLSYVSHALVSITSNTYLLLLLILFGSAIFSGLLDNIPFVAVMIPVIKEMSATGPLAVDPNAGLLWWALALGACFGGNMTMIGASANLITCNMAKHEGITIGFKDFLRDSIPVTAISIIVSALYLTVLYFW